jgi:hypothetical protein
MVVICLIGIRYACLLVHLVSSDLVNGVEEGANCLVDAPME